jgi:hypothetical protein
LNDPLEPEDVQVRLYNGRNEVVYQGVATAQRLELPAGLYLLRTEFMDEIQEQVVQHAGPTVLWFEPPARYGAAPLQGTATSHEYYSLPSQALSREMTREPLGPAPASTAQFFVFIRASSREAYWGEDLGEGLELLDFEGQPVSGFEPEVTRRHAIDGYLAFSAAAPPGPYLLRFRGTPAREMPIYLYQGWASQLFVTYHGRPLLEGASLMMAHFHWSIEGFDSGSPLNRAVEMALAGLQHGREFMPQKLMKELLYGKFENPMLGLLGAHFLLRRPNLHAGTVQIVLDNLANLLPGSPDVHALALIAARRLGQSWPIGPFRWPPMLRAGLEAVFAASAEQPGLIPEDGSLERIAPQLYTDSPWSSWRPLPNLVGPIGPAVAYEAGAKGGGDWLEATLAEALAWSRKANRPLDLPQLAADLRLPVRLVEAAYRRRIENRE